MMVGTEDEYLIDLVRAGKSLWRISRLLSRGRNTILNRLKFLGLADKDLTVEDCLTNYGQTIKKVMTIFTYEDFLEKILKEKKTQYGLAKELDIERVDLRYAIKKYKKRYFEETGITL